jgi:outer membrane protein
MKLVTGKSMFLAGAGLVSLSFFSSCKPNGKDAGNAATHKEISKDAPHAGQIAYVNLDTLEAKYAFFKTKKAEFEKRQKAMEEEVTRLAEGLQNEYSKFQEKVRKGTMTQSEGEAAQKKLAAMQTNVENRRQSLGTQLMKDQQQFQDDLQKRLDGYIAKYNKDQGYAYILTYVQGGSILFADPAFDITNDIIEGMNKEDKANPPKEDHSDSAQ